MKLIQNKRLMSIENKWFSVFVASVVRNIYCARGRGEGGGGGGGDLIDALVMKEAERFAWRLR